MYFPFHREGTFQGFVTKKNSPQQHYLLKTWQEENSATAYGTILHGALVK
jgi:hypothetical protein